MSRLGESTSGLKFPQAIKRERLEEGYDNTEDHQPSASYLDVKVKDEIIIKVEPVEEDCNADNSVSRGRKVDSETPATGPYLRTRSHNKVKREVTEEEEDDDDDDTNRKKTFEQLYKEQLERSKRYLESLNNEPPTTDQFARKCMVAKKHSNNLYNEQRQRSKKYLEKMEEFWKKERSKKVNTCKFKCKYCLKNVEGRKNFKKHEQLHTPFECKICKLKFNKIIELNQHLNEHVASPSSSNYKCEECKLNFEDNSSLEMHYTKMHFYACPSCEKRFLLAKGLAEHIISNVKKNKTFCSECIRGFETEKALNIHAINCHTCEK